MTGETVQVATMLITTLMWSVAVWLVPDRVWERLEWLAWPVCWMSERVGEWAKSMAGPSSDPDASVLERFEEQRERGVL